MTELPLRALRAGDRAWVERVAAGGSLVRRLREMGLHQGAEVRMVRPGSPCIIHLDGQTLCFRAAELDAILVRPAPASAPSREARPQPAEIDSP
ncbi:MAG: hypothetical protein KatS3mg108_0124 [Isosphaeraceae bacterium]|nr:MAG: hypothetical protein KatS3mg108_0124 [Isosphaeraceae bacterium]